MYMHMKYPPCSIRNLARGAPIPLVTPVIKAYFPFHLSIIRSVLQLLTGFLCLYSVVFYCNKDYNELELWNCMI